MMCRPEKGCNDREALISFLNEAQVLHLAIAAPGNVPYIVPLNYVYDDGCFYIHSATEGRKISLLRQNRLTGFAISKQLRIRVHEDNPCATGTSYKSVIGKAEALFTDNSGNKSRILNMLLAKYTGSLPVEYKEKVLNRLLIIKLKILEMAFKVDLR